MEGQVFGPLCQYRDTATKDVVPAFSGFLEVFGALVTYTTSKGLIVRLVLNAFSVSCSVSHACRFRWSLNAGRPRV